MVETWLTDQKRNLHLTQNLPFEKKSCATIDALTIHLAQMQTWFEFGRKIHGLLLQIIQLWLSLPCLEMTPCFTLASSFLYIFWSMMSFFNKPTHHVCKRKLSILHSLSKTFVVKIPKMIIMKLFTQISQCAQSDFDLQHF